VTSEGDGDREIPFAGRGVRAKRDREDEARLVEVATNRPITEREKKEPSREYRIGNASLQNDQPVGGQ
jgi:hypothetical protein